MSIARRSLLLGLPVLTALVGAACSAVGEQSTFGDQGGGSTTTDPGGGGGGDTITGTGGGSIGTDGGTSGGNSGRIPQTCAEAVANKSYIGCEYWPTVTTNSSLFPGFPFAVAVANPTTSPGTVKISRGPQVVKQVDVAPGALEVVELPWVDELKGPYGGGGDGSQLASAVVAGGAYHVESTTPITLYQFSPLEFELKNPPADCPDNLGTGQCFSYTNDASLVLPTTAIGTEYYVMSYPTLHVGQSDLFGDTWFSSPGFVAVTATEDGTTVDVTTTANVRGGAGVGAMNAGGTGKYTLNKGDVLQLETAQPQGQAGCKDDGSGYKYCKGTQADDLTGSHIVTNKPVSVIAGHDCAFVPFDKFACDHLEESLFPVDALGTELVVTSAASVTSLAGGATAPDTMFVRVLSAAPDNQITFDPPVHEPVTLGAGQWLEIGPVAQDFRVKASNKIQVSQFMVGENYTGDSVGAGDPSISIAIPTEQYRLEYTFFAPTTYTQNLVNVVAPAGASILLDGQPIPDAEFQPIGATGLSVARHRIPGGTHTMSGSKNFGIVVYGYGSYTSYMYPGGLNLEKIVVTPK
jgi:hypothetical protein